MMQMTGMLTRTELPGRMKQEPVCMAMCIRNFMKGMMLTTMNTGTRDRLGIRVKPVTSITTITTEASSRIISTNNNSSNSRVLEVHRIQTATLPDVQRWKGRKEVQSTCKSFPPRQPDWKRCFLQTAAGGLRDCKEEILNRRKTRVTQLGGSFFVFVKSIAY